MFSIDQENENPPASGPASDSAVVMTCARCKTSDHSIYECRKIVFLPLGADSSSSSSSSEESVEELPINKELWLKIRQTKPKEKIENDEESIKTNEEAEEVTTSFSSARKGQDSDWTARTSTPIDISSKTETTTADEEQETKREYIKNWLVGVGVGQNQVASASASTSPDYHRT